MDVQRVWRQRSIEARRDCRAIDRGKWSSGESARGSSESCGFQATVGKVQGNWLSATCKFFWTHGSSLWCINNCCKVFQTFALLMLAQWMHDLPVWREAKRRINSNFSYRVLLYPYFQYLLIDSKACCFRRHLFHGTLISNDLDHFGWKSSNDCCIPWISYNRAPCYLIVQSCQNTRLLGSPMPSFLAVHGVMIMTFCGVPA